LLGCSRPPAQATEPEFAGFSWRNGPDAPFSSAARTSATPLLLDFAVDAESRGPMPCQALWGGLHGCADVTIRCDPHGAPPRFNAELNWDTGRVAFARLDVGTHVYGGRTRVEDERGETTFVHTLTPATIDPDTNALIYAPAATPAAALILNDGRARFGVAANHPHAKELLMAMRAVATVALLGAKRFEPNAARDCRDVDRPIL
jgi:hypothetical protein